MNKLFLYRVRDDDDRDCCAYIESTPMQFQCGHYFSSINLCGSCYSGGDFLPYDDIETVLSREEYDELININEAVEELGYNIKKGDERYHKGVELRRRAQRICDKLRSTEAREFFDSIQASEREYLMDTYGLSDEQIEDIFDHYYLDFRDRSIIGAVFKDAYDCGYEEAWSFGYIDDRDSIVERNFDFQKFGEDLLQEDRYHELDDGRVVYYMY